MKTTSKTLLSLYAIFLLALAGNASANLVTDGGFENGIDDWQFTLGNGGAGGFSAPAAPHSGTRALLFQMNGFGTTPSTAFQNLSTVAGTSYDLSFFMSGGSNAAAGIFGTLAAPALQFQVFWGGVMIFDTTNPPGSYTQFSFGNLLATGASTQLMFTFNTALGFRFFLDDVSVEQTGSSVPDNFSTLWLALPLVGMVGVARLRRTSVRVALS